MNVNVSTLLARAQETVDVGGLISTIDAGVVVAAAVGVGQIWAIWSGIRQMRQASRERDRQLELQMKALEVLIERTAPPSPPEPAPLVVLGRP